MVISFFVSPFLNVDQHEAYKKIPPAAKDTHPDRVGPTSASERREFFGGSASEWEGRDDQLVSPQGTWCRRVSEEATKRWAHAPITRERRTIINQKKWAGRWAEGKLVSEDPAVLALEPLEQLPVAVTAAVIRPDVVIFTLFCEIHSLGWTPSEQLLPSASALSNQHLAHAVHANRNALMQGIMGVFEKPQSF